ncbi:MAG: DUF423 domain-containing protein [Pseudomonadales bacterium]
MAKFYLLAGGVLGFLAVAFGAFGAHGLKSRLTTDMLAVFQTGVTYHMSHALALLLTAALMLHWPQSAGLKWSAACFLMGVIVFSGSLYLLSLTGLRWLGAITPLGGLTLLLGWAAFVSAVYSNA